ncbi:ABC transporter ATP-binding protein [Ramlibacter sp. AW1]|uniref:ABC transporter ATP-binding protein n=2 Tax=Ramlibacter aurantiacus TaxID=2801330 RepID=A0A936ZM22_9BURK|nr:ABC transporter ATP-binding protein [Ramlibacter aurantiacus]MBL0423357.1 ABC transporter ATP-binding protein [Ramlibacter aurantiacus]
MRFGERTVIDRLGFTVVPGEFLCIVGASGCGKTTLLRILAGLTLPTEGEVRFEGQPITDTARERAIVFQDYGRALLPWRTVAGNIALALECCGVPTGEHAARTAELAATMGLGASIDRYPNQLSGGMQQRVQIARCLAQSPRLLLMDEPFGALDAITRQHLQDEVAGLAQSQGTTVVFITHDLEEAIYLGDRVIVLGSNPGRIVEEVSVDIPRPRDQLSTREHPEFLSLRHRLHGLLEGH